MTYEQQYINMINKILETGVWVDNARTGKSCLTIPNYTFTYKASESPLLTIKQSFPISAIAEMIGYLRGYTDAFNFDYIGTKSWYANANKTQAWLDNPNRKSQDHLGKIYGAIAKDFGGVDLIQKVYNNLKEGIDDRSEIITFYKPDEFDKGCIRPCMYSHHFTILDGVLYLNSTQRSGDAPLGLPYNAIQCWFLLNVMAQITGLEAGECTHYVVTPHIYEDQIEGVIKMMERKPLESVGEIDIQGWVSSLGDIVDQDLHTKAYVTVSNYEHLGKIDFPMSA